MRNKIEKMFKKMNKSLAKMELSKESLAWMKSNKSLWSF